MRVGGENPTDYEAIKRLPMGEYVMMIEEYLKRLISAEQRAKNAKGKPSGNYLRPNAH